MEADVSDEQALWAAIAAHPAENTPKLVLADWYDEHGDPDMARGLRWCAECGRWPHRYTRRPGAVWYRRGKRREICLPARVYRLARKRPREPALRFKSVANAVRAVGEALRDGEETVRE